MRSSPVRVREGTPPSPDGGLIADHSGPLEDPALVAARLAATPGVLGHGLFEPALVDDVLVAHGDDVEHRRIG